MKITLKLTLTDISRMTMTPLSTLYSWQKKKPKLYKALWRGCWEIKADEVRNEQA